MMIEETLAKIMYMAHQVHKRHKIYPCKWTCLATLLLLDLDCIRRCDSRLGECRPVYTESTVHVVWGVGEKKRQTAISACSPPQAQSHQVKGLRESFVEEPRGPLSVRKGV